MFVGSKPKRWSKATREGSVSKRELLHVCRVETEAVEQSDPRRQRSANVNCFTFVASEPERSERSGAVQAEHLAELLHVCRGKIAPPNTIKLRILFFWRRRL